MTLPCRLREGPCRCDVGHGRTSTYVNHSCRCAECRRVWSRYVQELKHRRMLRARRNPEILPHGTVSGYNNWKCRCRDCRRAAAAQRRWYYHNVRKPRREAGQV